MGFFISGFLMAFIMLMWAVNLRKDDKVCSISQIYLTMGPFFSKENLLTFPTSGAARNVLGETMKHMDL